MTRQFACILICGLLTLACGATPQSRGRIPASATDVFVGLKSVEHSGGQVSCELLSPPGPDTPALAWATDTSSNVLAMRISLSGDAQCDLNAEETARALLFLALRPVASEGATLSDVLTALRTSNIQPLSELLAAHPSLESALSDGRFATLFAASAHQVVQRLSGPPLGQRQAALSGLNLIPDANGSNGVKVTPAYSADGKSVDLEFTDKEEVNEVKGILVDNRLVGYLAPHKGFANYFNNFTWDISTDPISTKVPAKPEKIAISIVSPATLHPLRELMANPTTNELTAQSVATMASLTFLVYQLLEVMIMPNLRDLAKAKTECKKDIAGFANEVISIIKANATGGNPLEPISIAKVLATLFLDTDETRPGPGILRSCLGWRIGEKTPIYLKARKYLSGFLRFYDFLALLKAAVIDVGGGYPYIRHQLIGCTDCGASSPQCVDDSGCTSTQFCQSGRCVTDICTANASFCSGSELRRCNGNGSGSALQKSCAGSCYGGQCCGGSGDACCVGSVCSAGLLCGRNGLCQADSTPTRTAYRYMHICTYAHWQSSNSSCYPGSMGPSQGCGVCGKTPVQNGGCGASTATCWKREDDQSFTTYVTDPGYGSFSRIWHCFDGGVNTYSRTGCTTYGDPVDIGWIANSPIGSFVREVALCERPLGSTTEQFLSLKPDLECYAPSYRVVARPLGYVP